MNYADYDATSAKELLPWADYRAWWAWATLNPYPDTWRSEHPRPPPGVIDATDPEAG